MSDVKTDDRVTHTLGPWEAKFQEDWRPTKIVALGGARFIADVSNFGGCAEADARLIAAAPDLLTALVALYELVSTSDICVPDAKYAAITAAAAAIGKAEGQP